jgi:phage-related tail protein
MIHGAERERKGDLVRRSNIQEEETAKMKQIETSGKLDEAREITNHLIENLGDGFSGHWVGREDELTADIAQILETERSSDSTRNSCTKAQEFAADQGWAPLIATTAELNAVWLRGRRREATATAERRVD